MIKEINYELQYRIKGKKYCRIIKIDFIPNKRHDDFSKLENEIIDIQRKWNHVKALQQEVELLLKENELKIDAIKDFKNEISLALEEINKLRASDIIERRLKLIFDILTDNGYSDDKELMSPDFWDNCVEPITINDFLYTAIYKDIDKKKVVH